MDASEYLSSVRIVPVVVLEDAANAASLAQALCAAGLTHVEVTLRTNAALQAIERIASDVADVSVGAGSVRNAQQMTDAQNAGAMFAVSPGCSDELLEAADDSKLPFVPGAVTPFESMWLLEAGYTLQKFFPAELAGGAAFLKAIQAPLPEPRFFPTGGITPDNAASYLSLANVACIGGTWLAPPPLLAKQDFSAIRRRAEDAVALTL